MVSKLVQLEYLLAPMIWCDFEHFQVPSSIICWQILHSLTRCFNDTWSSSFARCNFTNIQSMRKWKYKETSKESTKLEKIIGNSVALSATCCIKQIKVFERQQANTKRKRTLQIKSFPLLPAQNCPRKCLKNSLRRTSCQKPKQS